MQTIPYQAEATTYLEILREQMQYYNFIQENEDFVVDIDEKPTDTGLLLPNQGITVSLETEEKDLESGQPPKKLDSIPLWVSMKAPAKYKTPPKIRRPIVFTKDQEKKEEMLSCEICYESFAPVQMRHPLRCPHMFCELCYIAYFSEKIAANEVLNIKCPDTDCQELFHDWQIKQIIPGARYDQYKRFKINTMLAQNPNLRWCIRSGCEKTIIGKEGCKEIMCECGMTMCFDCCQEYHPKKTCEQAADGVYKVYLKTHEVQRCPGCKAGFEKIEGCNHMTCTSCRYQWCWLCGGKYSSSHYSNLNPFGCSGLQGGANTRKKNPLWKIYLKRIFILLFCYLLAAPFKFIFFSALTPLIYLNDRNKLKFKAWSVSKIQCITSRLIALALFIIGIIFLPVFMLGHTVYALINFVNRLR